MAAHFATAIVHVVALPSYLPANIPQQRYLTIAMNSAVQLTRTTAI